MFIGYNSSGWAMWLLGQDVFYQGISHGYKLGAFLSKYPIDTLLYLLFEAPTSVGVRIHV
jgi:hypothetical protein